MKKQYRVKKNDEIVEILKERKIMAGADFVIYHKENREEEHYRYAISVPKKYGNAVERNLIKRRVRSAVRNLEIKNHLDFFIIIKTTAKNLSYEDISAEINSILKRAKILEVPND